jgi:CubicO group peptidase (beta-lactamase class C family)
MIAASGRESLEAFIKENVEPEYLHQVGRKKFITLLQKIRKNCARAGGISAEEAGQHGVLLNFETEQGTFTVQFQIQSRPPHQIVQLSFSQSEPSPSSKARIFDWDKLVQQLEEAAKDGFSGTVLVIRDGQTLVHQGYGMADRKRGIPNTDQTVFAIGSIPIDFTKGAILKLEDMGKLKTSDPISTFFSGVPTDKKTITIDHLMQARSGLPNFHHIPGQDQDYDLSWIDREEAVRRIFGKEQLFKPGEGEAHSLSAWTLLAALVEVVSGQSYQSFLQEHFFTPLEMTGTGLYQLARRLSPDRVAVGYGDLEVGKINSPAYWGETSWLVMGSGGMVSNSGDMHKWMTGLRRGGILSPETQAKYWTDGILTGGNDRGFFCLYTQGEKDLVILCSNVYDPPRHTARAVGRGLARLVMSE